ILIYVQLSKFGGMEIPAAIREETAFLSVTDLFDFLQIKNAISKESIIEGFILNPKDEFAIDPIHATLNYQGKEHELATEDFIWKDGLLFLQDSLFGKIFGLHCSFDFRSLSVSLSTELDLPVLRLKRQEMMRKNLGKLQEKTVADTAFHRKSSLARLSIVDWGIINTQQFQAGNKESQNLRKFNQSRINLSLGGELAFGEFNARLNFTERMPVQHRSQFYQWRYVNNEYALAKQITAGRINTQAVSTLYAPVTGVQVTNASTLKKKSFGSYRISDHTEPEWIVELYVNNLLIDYVQADATGFYTFEVPLMYGSTAIQLKFYGPHGEELSSEQFLNIPFNFVPKNELEYTLSSGLLEDGKGSVFSRGTVNYGLSNQVTLGGGVEYLSSLSGQPFMPFVHSSIRVADGLMFSGDYMPGIRTRALINYRLPESLQMDINYTKLNEGQEAIFYNYLEERKLSLSMPLKRNNLSLFSRLSISQMIYPTSRVTTGQLLLSSMLFGVNTQVSTFGTFRRENSSSLQTQISQTHRLPGNISFTPQLQYHYGAKKISYIMAKVDKRVSKRGFLNVFYQNNRLYKSSTFGIGFRYDFSFANTSMQMRQSNDHTMFTQTATGSLMYDGNTGHVEVNNRVNVGKGGITVLPFLDLNANGKRDEEESLVEGLKLKIKGGQIHYDKKGEAIRITNLMAYEDYMLELDKSSFDNIAWRIKNATIKVSVSPNQFRKVEVPISVMGEAAGMVYLEEAFNGIGRIKMNFYDDRDYLIHTMLTERDGYFSYMELPPGNYKIMPDSAQLQNLGYTFHSDKTSFTIGENLEGDYLDDLEFILHKNLKEPAAPGADLAEVSGSAERSLEEGMEEESSTEEKTGFPDESKEEIQKGVQEEFIEPESEQGENELPEQMNGKEKGSDASSDSHPYRSLRFTLKSSNPELLENLMGKSIKEQRQLVQRMGDFSGPIADASPSISSKDTMGHRDSLPDNGIFYKIQVMASEIKAPLDHPYFKGISNITEENHQGLFKYTTQPTSSYKEAREILKMMRNSGFDDAFMVVYFESKRLGPGGVADPAQADRIKQRQHPDTYYRIQILVSEKMKALDDPIFKGIEGFDYYTHHGFYKYTYGIALQYEEAVVLLSQVRAMGFEDAFIVSFYKRRRLD
ncbi:MAG: hypothetical protein WD426_00090, partial [Anditalea sp.]